MKSKRKKVIIIDSNHAAHRSYNTMGSLKHAGKKTGVIFGMLNILLSNCAIHKPNKVIACWDPPSGGRNPERLKILPNYKEREKRIDFDFEDFQRQNLACRKIFNSLGITQLMKAGNEADDLIYKLQKKYQKKGYKVIILSGDKDFNQLVSEDVFISNPTKGLITPLNFKKVVGLDKPEQFVDYLSLFGDKSDNIPGVKGYGEVTILKFLKKWGSIDRFSTLGTTERDYDKVIEGVGLSKPLIDLKWFNNKFKVKLDETFYFEGNKKPEKKIKRYKKLCSKYGLLKFQKEEYLKNIPK